MKVQVLMGTIIFACLIKFSSAQISECQPDSSGDCLSEELPPSGIACPAKTVDIILTSYPNNCTKFLKCLNGRLTVYNCPKGLHWDNYLKRCDWPEVADCSSVDEELVFELSEYDSYENPLNPSSFPHPTNCQLFYRCIGGKKEEIRCPPELHFSPKSSRCEYPAIAKCDDLTLGSPEPVSRCPSHNNPDIHTFLPHPTDCNKFIMCKSSIEHEMICPPGRHWNDVANNCDYPENVNCSVNNVKSSTTLNDLCSKDLNGLIRFPASCSKFIKCSEGLVHVMNCPEGLFWNDAYKQCDYALNSECKNEEYMPTPGFINPPAANEVPACPHLLNVNSFVPHSQDCSKFFQCWNGYAQLMQCPDGLHWNTESRGCDWPEIANCNKMAKISLTPTIGIVPEESTPAWIDDIPDIISTSNDIVAKRTKDIAASESTIISPTQDIPARFRDTQTKVDISAINRSLNVSSPSVFQNLSTFENIIQKSTPITHSITSTSESLVTLENSLPLLSRIPNAVFINQISNVNCSNFTIHQPHPTNRSRFYECTSNELASEMACPKNHRWNSIFNNCTISMPSPKELTNEFILNKLCPPDADTKLPIQFEDPENCSKYYVCENGEPHSRVCPTGLHWSTGEQFCDWPEFTQCQNVDDTIVVYHPDQVDCTKFLQSFGNLEIRVICPAGLYWNQEMLACDLPQNVICSSIGIFEINFCPVSNEHSLNDVKFADLKDCARFTKCMNGYAYSIQCPQGLHWNRFLGHCDWPEFAGCVVN